ncbi:MAG: hypothetical protein JW866_08190 [Ignavibacteriales bacterium]|nr:hypothetical protein [Ignavibacteriales bacterium]
MSAIEFLMSGGMASTGGDLPNDQKQICNQFIKKYGNSVGKLGRVLQIPASNLSIFKMNFLFIGKDISTYHFVFVDKPGGNTIKYKDLSTYGNLNTQQLIHQIRIEIGEVHWAFALPISKIAAIPDSEIEELAKQYINAIMGALQKKTEKISDNAINIPEIAREIESFRADYPEGTKTAFIIMQFTSTKAHDNIITTIKTTLCKHNVTGLRADDKEYSDDLFSNIKTYMHCCDFGISVFERITEDDFNPNVSIEVGYMLGLRKKVCLLKDNTLKNLPTDLMGKLYKPFDPQDIEKTLPTQLEKWMKDRGMI